MDSLIKTVDDHVKSHLAAPIYKVPPGISLPLSIIKCTINQEFSTIVCFKNLEADPVYFRTEDDEDIYFSLDRHQNGPLHTHDYIEFAYIVNGTFHQVVDGVEISLNRGDGCFANMRSPHYDVLNDSDCCVIFFCMSLSFINQTLTMMDQFPQLKPYLHSLTILNSTSNFLILRPNSDKTMQNTAETAEFLFKESLAKTSLGREHILRGLTLKLFELLEKDYHFKIASDPDTRKMHVYTAVEQYIRNNIATVTTKDLEREFHFNTNYFNKLIQRVTGYTYKQYVQKQRIDLAAHLLLTTNKTVREISEEVGYENRTFFYKLFKDNTGLSPTEFRKQSYAGRQEK